MATSDVNQKDVTNKINDSLGSVETQRTTELGNAKLMQSVRNNGMVKELARLTAKYGKQAKIVQDFTTRISYNPQVMASMDQEITRSNLKSPASDKNSWLINGRVFDSAGKTQKNVTVFLTEDGRTAINGINFSCTDASGGFTITVNKDIATKLKEAANLRLAASGRDQKLIYTSTDVFTPAIGKITSYLIKIMPADCAAPPTGDNQ